MSNINFQNTLLKWYNLHKRPLPWRNFKHPYPIWLSEIILQQTRVQQGLAYYYKFLEHYPDVKQLADATEDEVMKDWEGLGYYSRARNLHKGAKYIAYDLDGIFPETYTEILKIPGVGPYTASAISSFCFNEVRAVLDGNVYRVLSRYFGVEAPINIPSAQKEYGALAQSLISESNPGEYNQAIMEFGALQCTPKNPNCNRCPFISSCVAYKEGKVQELPKKIKGKKEKERFFNYLMFEDGNTLFLEKRIQNDIWKGMYEFPLLETEKELKDSVLRGQLCSHFKITEEQLYFITALPKHKLSHQHLYIKIWKVRGAPVTADNFVKVEKGGVHKYAMPRPLRKFVDDNQLPLPFGC